MRRALLLLSLASLALPGCGEDACRRLAPALELTVVAGPGLPAAEIRSLDVAVRAGAFSAARSFPIAGELSDGRTSLVVNLGDAGLGGFDAELTVTARDGAGAILIVAGRSVHGSGDGCNFVELSLSCSDDAGVYPELLRPEKGCWDVSGVFRVANHSLDPTAMRIFGKPATPGAGAENVVHALLAGAGDAELPLDESCTVGATTIKAAKSWSIVRKPRPGNEFLLSVRGNSKRDCDGAGKPLFPPVNEGELKLNRGWRIKSLSCAAGTACTGLEGGTSLSWRADRACPPCCACPEGAKVSADVVVARP